MGRRLALLLTTGALALTAGLILAHHSFAMFDRANQVDLEAVVQEFRFVNPRIFIYLTVKQDDGSTVTWSLEGQSPSFLVRDGWSSKTLKPGDELRMERRSFGRDQRSTPNTAANRSGEAGSCA